MPKKGSYARPDRPKFNVVTQLPVGLIFADQIARKDSLYIFKLQEAIDKQGAIEVLSTDKYLQMQIRKTALKMNIRLLWATSNGNVYIKPIIPSGYEERLYLLLREPRTMDELKAAKLELDLKSTLEKLIMNGLGNYISKGVHVGKFQLTERGINTLLKKDQIPG